MEESTRVKIKFKNMDMASVICQNSKENLYSFLKRMQIYVEEGWDKEVLALALKDVVCESPEYLFFIYRKEILHFLLGIWESEEMDLTRSDWAVISQLKLLGLIDYNTVGFSDGTVPDLYVVSEAKELFYFYLKSKSAKRQMEKYEKWESLLYGMLTYYGMISFQRLYLIFCKQFLEPIDDADLHLFLSIRISLFNFGSFAVETYSNMEYYQNFEVTDVDKTLNQTLKNFELEYCIPKTEEFIYVGNNNGLGSWDGISQLADIIVNKMELEYYRAVILVKSSVLAVQNGEKYESVVEQFFLWCEEASQYEDEIKTALLSLYESVPVYCLKGWTRKGLKEKNKKNPGFKILKGGISGGKDKDKKGGRPS